MRVGCLHVIYLACMDYVVVEKKATAHLSLTSIQRIPCHEIRSHFLTGPSVRFHPQVRNRIFGSVTQRWIDWRSPGRCR